MKFGPFVAIWPLNFEDQTIFEHFTAILKRGSQIGESEKIPSAGPGFDFFLRFCKTGAFSI